MYTNADRTVTADGIDITKYVLSLPTTPFMKPAWGEIVDLDSLSITVRTDDAAMRMSHPVSYFYGKKIDKMPLKVLRVGEVLWQGIIQDIPPDNSIKQATIMADSILSMKIRQNGRVDTTLMSPPEAAKRLLQLHGIPYDEYSFGRAKAILDDIPVRIRVRPDVLTWAGNIGDILRMIALAGIGRFYFTQSGAVGFDTWVQQTSAPNYSFTVTDDLQAGGWPDEADESLDEYNGYSIDWRWGNASAGFGNVFSQNFGPHQPIRVNDEATATYIGTQWVALSKVRYTRFGLKLNKRYALIAKLGDYIRFNSQKLGMIDRYPEIVGIDDGSNAFTLVTVQLDKAF